ncbi:hypothetical protein JCM8202v2_005454 [Rhodotorula sphaerocarpa]
MPRPALLPLAVACAVLLVVVVYRSQPSSRPAPPPPQVDIVQAIAWMKSIRTSCATPLPSQASSYAPLPSGAAQDDSLTRPPAQYYDENQPMSAKWVPYSSTCEPATDWLALIANRDVDSLSWLANRTILILGDSVDRNGLHHFAEMLGLPRYCVPYDDFGKKGQVPAGWDERGIPWVIEIPWTNTYFTNGFMYGLDDEDNFRQQPDWHPPGKAEDRIDQLFKVHTDQLPFPPSFVAVHSGLWDLAFFGRQDRVSHLSTEIPLTHQRVEWWQRRMKQLIKHVSDTWPRVPIWVRKLHRVGPVGGASYDWRHTGREDHGGQSTFSNFFTDIRIHTIREMQDQVTRDLGVPAYDFGESWEGWQAHQDMVHPKKFPGGPVYMQALLHHVWMESQGRDSWRPSKRRPVAPVGSFLE